MGPALVEHKQQTLAMQSPEQARYSKMAVDKILSGFQEWQKD
jgi:hypothetical protein